MKRNRHVHSIVLLLILMVWHPLPEEAAALPPGVDRDDLLRSVLVRDEDVFASKDSGLFRAMKKRRAWSRLPTPKSMPLGGKFAKQPDSSDLVIYFASTHVDPGEKEFGLYLSRDEGQTWRLMSDEHHFKNVFLHKNRQLFAIVEERFITDMGQKAVRDRILVSFDLGLTWEDITGDIGMQLFDIFQDPDHPDLVCLRGQTVRIYVLQAEDEDYDWEMVREYWEWKDAHRTPESFLEPRAQTSDTHVHLATLSNYFEYEFGEETILFALDIVTERASYEFEAGGPMAVEAEVKFSIPNRTIMLVDLPVRLYLWGLRVVDPDGEMIVVEAARVSRHDPEGLDLYRPDQDLVVHRIEDGSPYRRRTDITRLHDFSKIGTYRVQFVYDSHGLADRRKGAWEGSFSGPAFVVEVTE